MPPSALERWDEIAARLEGHRPALFLDYDGTLSAIAAHPELARLPATMREILGRLAQEMPVVIVSGRGREDVAALVDLPALVYAGSHGFDIAGPPPAPGAPPLRLEVGDGVPARIGLAADRLRQELEDVPGVFVEPKGFAISIHFRLADESDLPRVERSVDAAVAAVPGLRKAHGKKLFEVRPDLDWDKGRAVLWLLDALGLGRPDVLPFYLGDDLTDEDAFLALGDRGVGILVSEETRATAAAYQLCDPEEVRRFLERVEVCSASNFGARDLIEIKAEAPPAAKYPTVEAGLSGALARMKPGEVNLLGPFAVPELAPRLIRVYLPRDYHAAEPRFGLYLFDGQNAFEDAPSFAGGWHVHDAVEGLAKSKRPVPVVVGIDHGGAERILELSPFAIEEEAGKLEILLDWVTGHLMPALTTELNLIPSPLGAVIGGSSMGGLAAFWSHFRHPEAFGGALAMSPSFWLANQAIFGDIADRPMPSVSRLYLDAGAKEDKGRVVEAIQAMAEHLEDRGYDSDSLLWRADKRGTHNEACWRRRLPRALRFMYRRG
jgi:trehalose-phosphatase